MPDQDPQEDASSSSHLQTPFVFIDTQAYVANGFDWHGIHLGKLATLCADGTLKLLMPSITRSEVTRKIAEGLDEAIERTKKYRIALGNGGMNVELLRDPQKLLANAIARFDAFLHMAQAIDVPLNVSLEVVLDDYFGSKPPFSKRKDKEFPDAFVGASLEAWLRQTGNKAYFVSADGDFEPFCARSSSLIFLKSISELISRASVAATIHAELAMAIEGSDAIKDKLAAKLRNRRARTPRHWPRYADGSVEIAKVLSIMSVNVIDSAPPSFACELEFEAELQIELTVIDERERGRLRSDDIYARNSVVTRSFVGVVEVLFSTAEGLFIDTATVMDGEIELHMEDT